MGMRDAFRTPSTTMPDAWSTGNGPSRAVRGEFGPGTYSMAMNSTPPSSPASKKVAMPGCCTRCWPTPRGGAGPGGGNTESGRQDFQRGGAAEGQVVGPVDDPHAAGPQTLHDPVVGDGPADENPALGSSPRPRSRPAPCRLQIAGDGAQHSRKRSRRGRQIAASGRLRLTRPRDGRQDRGPALGADHHQPLSSDPQKTPTGARVNRQGLFHVDLLREIDSSRPRPGRHP